MRCKVCGSKMQKTGMNWYGEYITIWKCFECGFKSN